MEKYKATFFFKSRSESIGFKLESHVKDTIDVFTSELLNIFTPNSEKGKTTIKIYNPLIYDIKIIEKVYAFVIYWEESFPSIAALKSFFNRLKQDDLYVILYNIDLSTELSIYLSTHLEAWETDNDVKEKWRKQMEIYGKTFENYITKSAGSNRLAIGDPMKKERVCRFCQKSVPNVSFNKKAHAISEALGNKNVILYDECDLCNEKFGRNIEGDLITYLKLFRTFFGVNGKGGRKKIKGKNFEAFKDNENKIQINFKSIDDRPKVGEKYNLKLDFEEKIINQNIYKTLCKYFLSVIDTNQLENFEKTIKWIKNEFDVEQLPLIGEAINYQTFRYHPELIYFLRKSENNSSIPFAVCQFFFTCKMFLYIIPFSKKDTQTFDHDIDWKEIMKSLSHLQFQDWSFNDYSSKSPKAFTVRLNSNIETKE